MTVSNIIPAASLRTIKFSKLQLGSSEAKSKLLDACIEDGFFYLDLTEGEDLHMNDKVRRLFEVAKDYFELPLEEKENLDATKMSVYETFGYKPLGTHAGINEGKRDGFESFKIPSDLGRLPVLPAILEEQEELVYGFMDESRSISKLLLSALSDALQLPASNRFETLHRDGHESLSCMGLNKYPKTICPDADMGHNAHTDVGSITLLFCSQPGLQVLDPRRNTWAAVTPLPGHAIVNVGDSLRFLSDSVLRSCLHRVVPNHTDPAARYAVAFFLRPERETLMRNSEGERCSAQEWQRIKFLNYAESHERQRMSTIQTGGLTAAAAGKRD